MACDVNPSESAPDSFYTACYLPPKGQRGIGMNRLSKVRSTIAPMRRSARGIAYWNKTNQQTEQRTSISGDLCSLSPLTN